MSGPGRALVSGGAGFIGRHLCAALVERGYNVHALSRTAPDAACGPVRQRQLDLTDADATRAAFREIAPDVFFHLASHVVGTRDLAAVLPTFRDNALTTVNALAALAETGCRRCVLAGSLEEPDLAAGDLVPSSPYAASKATSTLYGNMFGGLYGLPITHARIFMVYGPGQTDLRKVIPFSIGCFHRDETPKFASLRPVDWIYVSDVVEGLIAAATSAGSVGQTVDLGTGDLVSVREVILEIARQMGVTRELIFEPLEERAMEQVRRADLAATEARVGWRPQVSIGEGLRRTIAYYREAADRPMS